MLFAFLFFRFVALRFLFGNLGFILRCITVQKGLNPFDGGACIPLFGGRLLVHVFSV